MWRENDPGDTNPSIYPCKVGGISPRVTNNIKASFDIGEIHREALDSNIINIVGEIIPSMQYTVSYYLLNMIGEELDKIAKKNFDELEPIKIYINSPGGDFYTSFAIAGIIESSTIPIYTYVTGDCASGAAYILMAGHKRYCFEISQIMLHSVQTGSFGTAAEMVEDIQGRVKPLEATIVKHLQRHTDLTKDEIKFILTHDKYFTAFQAKKSGIVDDMIVPAFKNREQLKNILDKKKKKPVAKKKKTSKKQQKKG